MHLEDGPHEAGWLAVVQWRGVGQSSGEPDSFELTAVDAAGLPLGWWSFDSCEGAQADAISSFQLGPEPWEACDDHMAHCSGNPHVWS
ncbi:MAG: hypothetical protein JWM47_3558 [Acidimicrobiales bacterium]|nr:hypothetical protein [Acidimicrobiales bacterium]